VLQNRFRDGIQLSGIRYRRSGIPTEFPAQHAPRRGQQRIATGRVFDRARKNQRADQGAHEMGDQVAVPLRIRAQAQGRPKPVEVADKTLRKSRAAAARQPAHIGADRHDEAAGPAIVAVAPGKIAVDQEARPLPRRRERGNALEVHHGPGKGLGAGLGDEFGLVVEMRVKPAVGQPRPPHDLIHAGRIHSALAKSRARRGDNAAAGLDFVIGGIAQGRFA